jgi:hypothetical protein
MRAHPDLLALVVRLAAYPAFSTDALRTSIEEAVVVVGTGRLRVLVQLWSQLRRQRGANRMPERHPRSNSSFSEGRKTPPRDRSAVQNEMAYLLNFLESLDPDSVVPHKCHAPLIPSGFEEAEFLELTDLLVRDIVSIIPTADPAPRSQQNTLAAGSRGVRKEESE